MIVRLEPELKEQLTSLAKADGKSSSQVVRDLLKEYVRSRDMSGYVEGLWRRIGDELTHSGSTAEDVAAAVSEARKPT